MNIQYISDLHLEWGLTIDIPASGDILVLAGDIHTGIKGLKFANGLADKFEHIIYIPGNHEYYGQDIDVVDNELANFKCKNNVHLLNPGTITINGTLFIGGTLWSDLSDPIDSINAKMMMNDYGLICRGDYYLSPQYTTKKHKDTVNFIHNCLLGVSDSVVVTHYLPHYNCIDKRYANSPINAAFATDLTTIFTEHEPSLWIHGHTHHSIDTMIHKTRVVCNPYGYFRNEVNPDFSVYKMIGV